MSGISAKRFTEKAKKKGYKVEELVGVSGAFLGLKVKKNGLQKTFTKMNDAFNWLREEA